MNKKVLKVMIGLVGAFLAAMYVLKFKFPDKFVLAVENETIVAIGNYIDSHEWSYYLFGIITSFITYWLYCCAVCRKWYLKWWQVLVIFATIGINILLSKYDITLYSAFSVITFVVLPAIFGSELKPVAICFGIHSINQVLTLSIRNIPVYMTAMNSLTIYIVGIESLMWLLLLYICFNYKIKEAK